MKNQVIAETLQSMAGILNNAQMEALEEALCHALFGKKVLLDTSKKREDKSNETYLSLFIAAKQVEGCSERTLSYYRITLVDFLKTIGKPVKCIDTDGIRTYLADFEHGHAVSKVTLDNIRRVISSFFSWLEEEMFIIKSPARRIHKIRTGTVVKPVFTDEEIEKIRSGSATRRDLAIVNLLLSTGIRVGELVKLDIQNVNFERRECIVRGKGNKERIVYFDAKTKLALHDYVSRRQDSERALFISNYGKRRICIGTVEHRLSKIGKRIGLSIHPHKFRRTLATRAIDKGMPIEQVQVLLGHAQIETTLRYAMVNQKNVQIAHQKYIS